MWELWLEPSYTEKRRVPSSMTYIGCDDDDVSAILGSSLIAYSITVITLVACYDINGGKHPDPYWARVATTTPLNLTGAVCSSS